MEDKKLFFVGQPSDGLYFLCFAWQILKDLQKL